MDGGRERNAELQLPPRRERRELREGAPRARGQLHYHHHGRTRALPPSSFLVPPSPFRSRLVCRRTDERVEKGEEERGRGGCFCRSVQAAACRACKTLSSIEKGRGESGRLVPLSLPAPLAAAAAANFADEGLARNLQSTFLA